MRQAASNLSDAIGTDAFLDIVANLVGILLIFLMVIGVRMEDASQVSKPTAMVDQESVAELATKPLPPLPVPLMLPDIEIPDPTDAKLELSKVKSSIQRSRR